MVAGAAVERACRRNPSYVESELRGLLERQAIGEEVIVGRLATLAAAVQDFDDVQVVVNLDKRWDRSSAGAGYERLLIRRAGTESSPHRNLVVWGRPASSKG